MRGYKLLLRPRFQNLDACFGNQSNVVEIDDNRKRCQLSYLF